MEQENKESVPPAPMIASGLTVAQVLAYRKQMFERSCRIIETKGADYNRKQQRGGDTLFNLRMCEVMGVVPTAEHGIMVRLTDKLMRLASLLEGDPKVVGESFEDTVLDVHNYVDYLGLLRAQRRGEVK